MVQCSFKKLSILSLVKSFLISVLIFVEKQLHFERYLIDGHTHVVHLMSKKRSKKERP